MIPVEVDKPSLRRRIFYQHQNKENLLVELEMTEEISEMGQVRNAASKKKIK